MLPCESLSVTVFVSNFEKAVKNAAIHAQQPDKPQVVVPDVKVVFRIILSRNAWTLRSLIQTSSPRRVRV